jgi:hypothetical protein
MPPAVAEEREFVTLIFRGFSLYEKQPETVTSLVFMPMSEMDEQLRVLCPFSLPETVTSMVLVPGSEVAEQLKDLCPYLRL